MPHEKKVAHFLIFISITMSIHVQDD